MTVRGEETPMGDKNINGRGHGEGVKKESEAKPIEVPFGSVSGVHCLSSLIGSCYCLVNVILLSFRQRSTEKDALD